MKRSISKKNCGLLFDYLCTSLNFDFVGNKYITIWNGNKGEDIPIHNISYNIENGRCWKAFTMKGNSIYSNKTHRFEQIKVSVSICLSHNRAIKVKQL